MSATSGLRSSLLSKRSLSAFDGDTGGGGDGCDCWVGYADDEFPVEYTDGPADDSGVLNPLTAVAI